MKILVVTETDSCCGPMAAAFLNDYSTSIEAVSVGRNPSQSIDLLMVVAMKECLADLEDYVPKSIGGTNPEDFDMIYECPDLPSPTTMEACRELRDYIKNEAFMFFKIYNLGRPMSLPKSMKKADKRASTYSKL